MPASAIIPLEAVEAVYREEPWSFAIEQRAEIERRWAAHAAGNPHFFNGTVLIQHEWRIENGVYRTAYGPVDYASFLIWRELGFPGPPRRNGFAMAAMRSRDGAFILGVMGEHTANAGKIYFAGGTPDMNDVTTDGVVDLAGSLRRELIEETGLRPDEIQIEDRWVLALDEPRAAFLKAARLVFDAEEARHVLTARLATLPEQELSGFAVVRSPADIDDQRTPPWAADYMRWVFQCEASEQ